MKRHLVQLLLASGLAIAAAAAVGQTSLKEQNEKLFDQMRTARGLTDQQMRAIRAIFVSSGFIGQGNPAISVHPDTPEQCQAKLDRQSVTYANAEFDPDARTSNGVHRSDRTSRYPMRLSRRLGTRQGGLRTVRGGGEADLRCSRVGRRVRWAP